MILAIFIRLYQISPWRGTCSCGTPVSCSERGRQAALALGTLRALPQVLGLVRDCAGRP